MTERENTCKGCRFYEPPADIEDDARGLCRVRAPQNAANSRWPMVLDDDWCGEWASLPVVASGPELRPGWEREVIEGRTVGPWRKGGWTVGIHVLTYKAWACPPPVDGRPVESVECTSIYDAMVYAEHQMDAENE